MFMLLIGTDTAAKLSLLQAYGRKNRKTGKKNPAVFITPSSGRQPPYRPTVVFEFTRDGAEFSRDGAEFSPDGAELSRDGAAFSRDGAEFSRDDAETRRWTGGGGRGGVR